MPLPDPDVCPARSPDVVARQVAGETIIVPIRSHPGELDDIFTLNEVATSVWELIDGKRTIADIAAAIATEFEVIPEQCLLDTCELIAGLFSAETVYFNPERI